MAADDKASNVVALRRTQPGPRWRPAGYALIAAGLIFLIPALLDAGSEIRVFTQFRATTCTLLGKRLTQAASLDGPVPEFTLRLDANGQQRIAAASDSAEPPDAERARQALDRYALWQDYPCWYDPAEPGRAVLSRTISPRPLLGLVPLLALAFGIGMLRAARSHHVAPPTLSPEQLTVRRWNIGIGIGFSLAVAILVAAFFKSVPLGTRPAPAAAGLNNEAMEAFEAGQLDTVRAAIEAGAEPDMRDPQGAPLLIRTLARCGVKAQSGDYGEFAVYLLQKGAAVNIRAGDGTTPLIAATRACSPALVRTLIGAGAAVNDHNGSGESALRLALRQGRADVAQMLRAAGALE